MMFRSGLKDGIYTSNSIIMYMKNVLKIYTFSQYRKEQLGILFHSRKIKIQNHSVSVFEM